MSEACSCSKKVQTLSYTIDQNVPIGNTQRFYIGHWIYRGQHSRNFDQNIEFENNMEHDLF